MSRGLGTGCAGVAPRALIYSDLQGHGAQLPMRCYVSDNRSKFNVPLGVEAQGFCMIR